MRYYRDHRDWISHLAVKLSACSICELAVKQKNGEPDDLLSASHQELEEAGEMLKNIGVRTPDQSPPAWHLAVQSPAYVGYSGFSRATKPAPEDPAASDEPSGDIPLWSVKGWKKQFDT